MDDQAETPPPETPRETFQRQLHETRRRAGLTQEALAEKVRDLGGALHATAITRIEKGRRDVSLEEALLLAAALDVSPPSLFVPAGDVTMRLASEGKIRSAVQVAGWARDLNPLEGPGGYSISDRPDGWDRIKAMYARMAMLEGRLEVVEHVSGIPIEKYAGEGGSGGERQEEA